MADTFPGTANWLQKQWSNPSDIFTVLLIIGGDVVRAAVAQLCIGPVPYLTPVTFSFGWVQEYHSTRSLSTALTTAGLLRSVFNGFGHWRRSSDARAGKRLYGH